MIRGRICSSRVHLYIPVVFQRGVFTELQFSLVISGQSGKLCVYREILHAWYHFIFEKNYSVHTMHRGSSWHGVVFQWKFMDNWTMFYIFYFFFLVMFYILFENVSYRDITRFRWIKCYKCWNMHDAQGCCSDDSLWCHCLLWRDLRFYTPVVRRDVLWYSSIGLYLHPFVCLFRVFCRLIPKALYMYHILNHINIWNLMTFSWNIYHIHMYFNTRLSNSNDAKDNTLIEEVMDIYI